MNHTPKHQSIVFPRHLPLELALTISKAVHDNRINRVDYNTVAVISCVVLNGLMAARC